MKTTYLKPVLDLAATGAKIKTVMKDKGITARELQIIMDFPYVQTIYNWFAGKNMPTIDNLVVLAKILAVPMDDLIAGSIPVQTIFWSCVREVYGTGLLNRRVSIETPMVRIHPAPYFWLIRITASSLGFHPSKTGSTPVSTSSGSLA